METEDGMPPGHKPSTSSRIKKATAILHGLLFDDVILLDVVGSLADDLTNPRQRRLSVPPVKQPYDLPEPRNGVAFDQGMIARHEEIKDQLNNALRCLKRDYEGKYCLERFVDTVSGLDTALASGDKTDGANEDSLETGGGNVPGVLSRDCDLKAICEPLKRTLSFTPANVFDPIPLNTANAIVIADFFSEVFGRVVVNPTHDDKFLMFPMRDLSVDPMYRIPPQSSFLLGPFNESFSTFDSFAYDGSVKHPNLKRTLSFTPGFDFILMDPAWPNRSATRSRAYDVFDPYDLFQLKAHHLREGGIVGVWVTNKSKWYNFVADKLFPSLGLELAARWIWLKVTEDGEPIFNLESVSRKPYEFLLLGRKPEVRRMYKPEDPLPLIDKVLVGVPEIHSRKPCLKEFILPYLPVHPEGTRACEIFARNLVRGWFSWGDEVLQGNSESCVTTLNKNEPVE